ncbi:hypothetical protein OROMI_022793 [Orobanche minor]
MGEFLSKPSQPDFTASNAAMSSQNREQNDNAKTLESKTSILKNPDLSTDPNTAEIQTNPSGKEILTEENLKETIEDGDANVEGTEVEEEDEGECGFCLFMKAGGCKDTFTNWEKCVEEGEKNNEDIVDKCFEATSALKKCMEAHSDYYAPLLEAEKAAEEEAAKQLEEESKRLKEESGEKEKEETLGGSEEKNLS